MPLSAYALVIGVDAYERPEIPRLTGCAADAGSAANWLVRIGVPAANVFLHVSQADGALPLRTPCDVQPADLDSITRSMQALKVRGGDQLFVFMSGHGLYVPVDGPIFLPANYASPSTRANMKINEYIRWFLSWPYRDQYLFYDACQNPTAAIGQVSAVQATGPDPDPATYAPLDGSGLTACYAVSPGQEAWAGDGSGVLIGQVVGGLDPARWAKMAADAQEQDAVLYDWTTGQRRIDLKALFNGVLKPAIEMEVAAAGHVGQTPFCQLHGRALDEDRAPVLVLPQEPCSQISISIRPAEAVDAVDQVRLTIPTPSRTRYLKAPPSSFAAPITCLAPTGATLEARCRERADSAWRTVNSPLQEVLNRPIHALVFELDRPTAPPPVDPSLFNIRAVGANGERLDPFGGAYEKTAEDGGVSMAPPPGVEIKLNEHGPDIGFAPGAEASAARYADGWLQALRRAHAGSPFDIFLSRPGGPPLPGPANLRFEFSDGGGAEELAGYLADAPVVVIEPVGLEEQSRRLSPRQIAGHPSEYLEPGPYRIRLDLPWGSWSRRVTVEGDGPAVRCVLSTVGGTTPLRHRLLAGDQGVGRIRGRSRRLLRFPYGGVGQEGFSAGGYGVDLLVGRVGERVRVEPFSKAPLPEWDQLFSVGRLADVGEARTAELLASETPEPERSLLALGLAYAALENGSTDVLASCLEAIAGPLAESIDARLLQHRLAFGDEHDDEAESALLHAYDEERRLPVLRWAAPMIQVLAGRRRRPAPGWLGELSSDSVWTVLTPDGLDLFQGLATTWDASWLSRDEEPDEEQERELVMVAATSDAESDEEGQEAQASLYDDEA